MYISFSCYCVPSYIIQTQISSMAAYSWWCLDPSLLTSFHGLQVSLPAVCHHFATSTTTETSSAAAAVSPSVEIAANEVARTEIKLFIQELWGIVPAIPPCYAPSWTKTSSLNLYRKGIWYFQLIFSVLLRNYRLLSTPQWRIRESRDRRQNYIQTAFKSAHVDNYLLQL